MHFVCAELLSFFLIRWAEQAAVASPPSDSCPTSPTVFYVLVPGGNELDAGPNSTPQVLLHFCGGNTVSEVGYFFHLGLLLQRPILSTLGRPGTKRKAPSLGVFTGVKLHEIQSRPLVDWLVNDCASSITDLYDFSCTQAHSCLARAVLLFFPFLSRYGQCRPFFLPLTFSFSKQYASSTLQATS